MNRWDVFKKWIHDYETQKKKEIGCLHDPRYSIAISIDDIKAKMNKIDEDYYKNNKNKVNEIDDEE